MLLSIVCIWLLLWIIIEMILYCLVILWRDLVILVLVCFRVDVVDGLMSYIYSLFG